MTTKIDGKRSVSRLRMLANVKEWMDGWTGQASGDDDNHFVLARYRHGYTELTANRQ